MVRDRLPGAGLTVGFVNHGLAHGILLRRMSALARLASEVRQGNLTEKMRHRQS